METLIGIKSLYRIWTVIELPIRDGNQSSISVSKTPKSVIELPIRDGNLLWCPTHVQHASVIELPIRDGNSGYQNHIR